MVIIKLKEAHIYNLIYQKLTKLLKFFEQGKWRLSKLSKSWLVLSIITEKSNSECKFEIKI